MENKQEAELLEAFRQLEPEFKELILRSVKGQAARCVARRPKLRLVACAGRLLVASKTVIAKNA